jgi:hypothetical protein
MADGVRIQYRPAKGRPGELRAGRFDVVAFRDGGCRIGAFIGMTEAALISIHTEDRLL